ncbi:MAG: CBS domain-containing protein [Pseudomonadota bacterium]
MKADPKLSDIHKPVSRIMSSPVVWIDANASAAEAAAQMMIHGVGFLPVLKDGDVVGTVTDRDLAIDTLPRHKDVARRLVHEIMHYGVQTCTERTTVEEAAHLMGHHQVRRLPVLNAKGVLMGVVSVADIAVEVSEHLAGETLGEIAEER